MHKISVIVPVYNVEPYLRRCLDSILTQDFEDIELILVASPSPDESVNICREYARADRRVRLLETGKDGLSAARNRGMEIAQGDYISFIDSDDYILPGIYSKFFNIARKTPCDIAAFGVFTETIGDTGSRRAWFNCNDEEYFAHDSPDRYLMYRHNLSGRCNSVWNKIYRKLFLEDINIKFNEGATGEDAIFNAGCFARAKSLIAMSGLYYVYSDRDDSLVKVDSTQTISKNISIRWQTYKDNIEDSQILTIAAARIISSVFYMFKVQERDIGSACRFALDTISQLELEEHLSEKALKAALPGYLKATSKENAENLRLFIKSLNGGYDSMLAWQTRYLDIEKR